MRSGVLWLVACFLLVIFPLASHALAALVFDPSVFARLGEEALQLKNQLDVLKQQLNAIKQLKPSQYQWSNAQGLINQLGSLIEASNGLSYSARDVDRKFKESFPGYSAPTNFSAAYEKLTNRTLNTLNGVLNTMGRSAADFQTENARLAFLQSQEKSALGQTQAIQAASQIASEQVSQLQLLRQTIMAQTTAESTYFASQIQQNASQQAELQHVLQAGSQTAPAIGHSGHAIDLSTLQWGD
jgi:P-type conjugative transfer protein TrbJ